MLPVDQEDWEWEPASLQGSQLPPRLLGIPASTLPASAILSAELGRPQSLLHGGGAGGSCPSV